MSDAFIDELKNNISLIIPTSSGIVEKIFQAINNEKSHASDVVKILDHDPPLTAKILQVANSAFYGSYTAIDSIQRAIVILGFNSVVEIIKKTTITHHFLGAQGYSNGLWLHSVGTAKAAQLISKRLNNDRADVTYTTGLLHDIGRIQLALFFPEKYDKVVQLASEKKCRIILAEQKVLKIDHCTIGKILCAEWKLPEDISDGIVFHHDPIEAPKGSQIQTRIVSLADYMCRKAEIGNPGDEIIPEPSSATLAILGSKSKEIEKIFDEIFQELLESKDDIEVFFAGMNE